MRLIGINQPTIDNATIVYNAQHPAGSTTSSYEFTTTLTIGSSGSEVTQLQTVLTQKGYYSGPITGYFGSLTAAGVKAFQKAKGLSQVGIVGPQTRAALNQ
jgi:peptidoglycan hydrolase-like protein with peptidoglycan-binding domain